MALESIFKLSMIVSMIDRMSGPAAKIQRSVGQTTDKFQQFSTSMAACARDGVVLVGTGTEIAKGMAAPVKSIFGTQDALAELSSLGVESLGAVEDAAKQFTSTWAGTSKAEFISAAYDIKSGIASLTDEGVTEYTRLAGMTAKATKATIGQMTDLFATGYGIYKGYYEDLSDIEFAEMFSGGISQSVKQFKTNGSEMASAISALGGTATQANVPLEEQLSVLGMLQATMGGSEAGTKYTAFLQSAAKAGEELGLKFTDANGQLKSMPEVLGLLKGKFGETMTAANKVELQKAFGTIEAVKLIDLLYGNIDDLQGNILTLYDTMGKGTKITEEMANTINAPPGQSWQLLQQQMQATLETVGNAMLPQFFKLLKVLDSCAKTISSLAEKHPHLVSAIMYSVMAFGVLMAVMGAAKIGFAGIGSIVVGATKSFKLLTDLWDYSRIAAMLMGDKLAVMGKAFPGLIAKTWAWTSAMLANPVTWVVIGIIALIAAIILLWRNWDLVTAWCRDTWNAFVGGIRAGFDWIRGLFEGMPGWMQEAVAALFPFISIPMAIISHWDQISAFMVNLWNNISTTFMTGIQRVKDFFIGLPEWFQQMGANILSFFTNGIRSMVEAPVEAVRGALSRIRKLLPFSDAQEGPLSDLTLSGSRVFTTFRDGMEQTADLPAQTMEKAVELQGGAVQGLTGADGERQLIIEKLVLAISLKDIEDIQKLRALLEELEDETNSVPEIDITVSGEGSE
ncbi:phage tail tape measure protein, TP901 family, core region [Ruminococcaceae bacterium D5]|nr:phage tail tape measure protein, TP901 family, core region [Ruminococcaceae bacterium D5]